MKVVSLDPPPLELDRRIEGLKRLELNIPKAQIDAGELEIKVRLRDKKLACRVLNMSYNCNTYSILALIFFFFFIKSKLQIFIKEISRAIDLKSLYHPYLYFNESEKKDLIYRIENDSESNDIFRELEAKAKVWLSMPVDYNIPKQGKNTRADWTELDRSSKYSQYYSSNRNNSFLLAFLYQITGDKKYADKAFEFADAFCDLTTWTQRAHRVSHYLFPYNALECSR